MQGAFARLRFGAGNADVLHKRRQGIAGLAVEYPAPGDNQGALRGAHLLRKRVRIRAGRIRRQRLPDPFFKKRFRVIVRLGLRVLAQRKRNGAAARSVHKGGHGPRQRRNNLFGPRDPVEISGYRTETVVRAYRTVAEILDLLQYGVRAAIGEHVPGQKQDGQTVGVRKGRRRNQIRGAGSDRGRARHGPPPHVGLRVGDRRQRHGLLVVRPPGGQNVLVRKQRLAHGRHVAVAENSPHAREIGMDIAVVVDILARKIPHQRL